ncbi:spore photoproduct lyase family protein [Methanosarcina sp.]|uniref:spore photoproduct lyase family protein n=1 Tax=Methanosarcina sp. TaxID=2213 RepID=UPI002AB88EB7|nr:HepT-like ribonuclease domain-containing protein [Methanosarcina sp.]MDY9927881.1 HepT-like ribonuclease domain-containing protein [Methanosarcina sp.]
MFAVSHMLEIIGEATKHIPEAVRKDHPFVLWRKMIVIREVIIHAYFGVNLKHNGRTRFHVSISFMQVIQNFEQNPAGFDERIEAASKLSAAGYTIGFIVAQIMIYDRCKEEYLELLGKLRSRINMGKSAEPVIFELIQHRFTPVAKKFILERFPNTSLDMDESKRTLKWGKFGRYKYVYPKEDAAEIKVYLISLIEEKFSYARIEFHIILSKKGRWGIHGDF